MIITNSPTQPDKEARYLGERLTELLSMSSQFDMLVGFFYFSGIRVIADALRENTAIGMRVLVGLDMERSFARLVETVRERSDGSFDSIREAFFDSVCVAIGDSSFDTEVFHERLGLFIQLLEEGRLEIRKTRDPNHAKLYIFHMDEAHTTLRESVWITGSSNFSESGLRLQDEFNVEISDFGNKEVSAFYERLWERAVPITEDEETKWKLLDILKNRSVAAEITPFEAYIIVLHNYIEFQQTQIDELRLAKILDKAGFTKYTYQVDAVAQARKKLDDFGGVILADVVGLGKSVIASLLGALSGARGIVICPPALMGDEKGDAGGWHEYLEKFQLKSRGWEVWSRGKLEALQERIAGVDGDFDMVIVDEAHSFRNERSSGYEMLANICSGKKVVLLTATPFNNKPGDLLALLHLFSSGKNSPFVIGGNLDAVFDDFSDRFKGITRLNKAIVKDDQKELEKSLKECGINIDELETEGNRKEDLRRKARTLSRELAQDIRGVVENIVIRRNRIDLREDPVYSREITTLSQVCPPVTQYFELTAEQNVFYDYIINDCFVEGGLFKGAAYYPHQYVLDDKSLDDYQQNLFHFMRRMLVLRFESSFGAFRKSMMNALSILNQVHGFSQKFGYFLYSRQAMDKLMDDTEDDDDAEATSKLIDVILKLHENAGKTGKRGWRNELMYNLNDGSFDSRRFLAELESDIKLFQDIIEKVDKLNLINEDPKCDALIETIASVLNNNHADIKGEREKRKVIVFTTYTDTQLHVTPQVAAKFGADRVLGVSGSNYGKELAQKVRTNFDASAEDPADDYDILVTTDKLSEGFNLNRAGLVINYDIPWNPTRVIQRVGRINRIGKKVFENLYILNFFPTEKGRTITQNVEIAQTKMYAIHDILGEDARIFSIDEEPGAAGLFLKLTSTQDEEMSFYTAARIKYNKAMALLQKNNNNAEQRLLCLPMRVKTAFESCPYADNNVKGIFTFQRQGSNYFAVGYNRATDEMEQWALEDAITQIECDFGTPRVGFSGDFWGGGETDKGKKLPGLYERLTTFVPTSAVPEKMRGGAGLSNHQLAFLNLNQLIAAMDDGYLKEFAVVVREDVQNYRLLPQATVSRLAIQSYSQDNKEQTKELCDVLEAQYRIRGPNYLDAEKARSAETAIIVTVEKK